MIQEEILHKTSRTGTTVFYFVPNITPAQVPLLEEPAYVIFNNFNMPIFYSTFNGKELWKLEEVDSNYYLNVELSSVTTSYLTGYSTSQTFNTILSSSQRATMEARFTDNVTKTITAQTQVPIQYQTFLFYEQKEIDDMFVNVKLNRTYETLDTLNVYNKPINSIPSQEARTGVVFGKLQAIQSVKDEEGNHIKIPLRNVPIGIFNKSEEFPTTTSVDNDGNRFYMNLKESSMPGLYFDNIAYTEDQKFLRTNSQLLSVPEKFKYITVTNDNGEFVIYDAPLGNQIMVLEVDLFKQGLSKDEIILNNFPFPTDDESIVGDFPCYYYNQVPVDVVPAWGTSQTGYTELNINVNLDLRKWSTYIFAPGAYGNEKLEATVAKNVANTLKIQVRDMTVPNFAAKTLEVTQIPDDIDRRDGSRYIWYNELLQQRQQLQYDKFGCHVLKLPGNIYDPNGYSTDNNGVPSSRKGVWLSAYQFNVFVNKDRCVRQTGGYKWYDTNNKMGFWSHFDVNNYPSAPANAAAMTGVGKWPYEKPWSINYPTPYSIPKKPTKLRFNWDHERTYGPLASNDISTSKFILEEPAYEDGDLVGNEFDDGSGWPGVGGFGLQEKSGVWFPNRIAFVATKNYMYKYERGIAWYESYANGYQPLWTSGNTGPWASYPALAGMSSVINGEKFQRLECGYGYFMKYHNWPRNFRWRWYSDIYLANDVGASPGNTPSGDYGDYRALLSNYHNTYNLDDQNIAFAFDQFDNNKINQGGIDIYRIVESGKDNIKVPENFLIPTFARLSFGGQADRLYALYIVNNGVVEAKLQNKFNNGAPVVVQNPGEADVWVGTNGSFILKPGGLFYVYNSIGGGVADLENEVKFTAWNFPGNDSFNSNSNKYDNCHYTLGISIQGQIDGSGNIPTSGFLSMVWNVSANISPTTWYLQSSNTGSDPYNAGGYRHGVSGFGMPTSSSIYSLYIDTSLY